MESIVVEIPRYREPTWLEEMVHEFTEDPYCLHLMLGADDATIMLVTIWAGSVASEVESGLRAMADDSIRVRRLELSVPEASTETQH